MTESLCWRSWGRNAEARGPSVLRAIVPRLAHVVRGSHAQQSQRCWTDRIGPATRPFSIQGKGARRPRSWPTFSRDIFLPK